MRAWHMAVACTLPLLMKVACAEPPPLPERLSQTGLFVAGSTRQVQARVLAYAPRYPLWSDGATKRRWIALPPGGAIDAAAIDAWNFPPGTRLWKEFAHGRPIETRMIERLADGQWRYASYVWTADGSDAVLASAQGVRSLPTPEAPGGRYTVPSRTDCLACHDNGSTPVLGFSAFQLPSLHDPGAVYGDTAAARPPDLLALQSQGLLVHLPASWQMAPPGVAGRSDIEHAALGYLHANCGHCHNDGGPLAALDMNLQQRVDNPAESTRRTLSSLLDRPGRFQPEPDRMANRIRAGDADNSLLLQRMRDTSAMRRMPPIGVSVPDVAGIALVRQWITQLSSTHMEKSP